MRRASELKVQDLTVQIEAKARLAVAQFQERAGGRLDYSPGSLSVVEEMLEEAAVYTDQLEEKDRNALVELFGSYILMVAFEEHGGAFSWFEQRTQPVLVVGEPEYHMAIITFDKVRGRLEGDKADDIPFFYQGFSERVRSARPGTRALHV
jgi:hypothetical protein